MRVNLFCLIFFGLSGIGYGQTLVYPVQIRGFGLNNPTVYLSDISDMPSYAFRPLVALTLRDPSEQVREVYLDIVIKENGTEVMRTVPGGIGLSRYELRQGIPKTLTGQDIKEYLELRNLVGSGRSNVLRPGWNELCIQVIDASRMEAISLQECIRGYWDLLDPPLLTMPEEGAQITTTDLMSRVFSWQMMDPRAGLSGRVVYDFELREVPPGLNPQDGFDNYVLLYQQSDQLNNLIFYNQLTPLLEPGKTYGWRVRAKRVEEGQVLSGYFKNNGYSVVRTLRIQEIFPPAEPESPPSEETTITYGSIIKLKHVNTDRALHSHNINYAEGSKQQEITGFCLTDDNDLWKVLGPHGTGEWYKQGEVVQNHDIIRLYHEGTGKFLHSHDTHRAPITKEHFEVTGFINQPQNLGDENDNWIFQISLSENDQKKWSANQKVVLKHSIMGEIHYLHSHFVNLTHKKSSRQLEVTAAPDPFLSRSHLKPGCGNEWSVFEIKFRQTETITLN